MGTLPGMLLSVEISSNWNHSSWIPFLYPPSHWTREQGEICLPDGRNGDSCWMSNSTRCRYLCLGGTANAFSQMTNIGISQLPLVTALSLSYSSAVWVFLPPSSVPRCDRRVEAGITAKIYQRPKQVHYHKEEKTMLIKELELHSKCRQLIA